MFKSTAWLLTGITTLEYCMAPVRFKTEIQYKPALVSVKVQYLARTGRCARFVSVGLYFDISSPRLSILDKSCPEHTVRCALARAPHRHTHVTHTVEVSQECCFLTLHNGFCSHLRKWENDRPPPSAILFSLLPWATERAPLT